MSTVLNGLMIVGSSSLPPAFFCTAAIFQTRICRGAFSPYGLRELVSSKGRPVSLTGVSNLLKQARHAVWQ